MSYSLDSGTNSSASNQEPVLELDRASEKPLVTASSVPYTRLQKLVSQIGTLDVDHNINLGVMLYQAGVSINDLSTQLLVNMTYVPEEVVERMETYLVYAMKQEDVLAERDQMTEKLKLLLSPE